MARPDYQHELASHAPRFYAPDLLGDHVILPEDQGHHARTVMRLKPGSAVELFDGRGAVVAGTLVAVNRGEVVAEITERHMPVGRPEPQVELAFAVPKGKRLDWLLEKATELGVASLQPVIFERSVAGGDSLAGTKRERWGTHCIAAAKQCRTVFLPTICDPVPLDAYLAGQEHNYSLVGDVSTGSKSIFGALRAWKSGESIGIIVGPEGDFSAEEWNQLLASGVQGVHLGHTILRVETAAVALLAASVAACESGA